MKLSQVKGNTWVIEANQLIPLYKLGDGRCVLLDTGLFEEREELEETLLSNGLTPAGVLCSHAHVDHCANSGYFQKEYGAKIALTYPEAGMCASLLNLKCYFLTLSLPNRPHAGALRRACLHRHPGQRVLYRRRPAQLGDAGGQAALQPEPADGPGQPGEAAPSEL